MASPPAETTAVAHRRGKAVAGLGVVAAALLIAGIFTAASSPAAPGMIDDCTPSDVDEEVSVARQWIEVVLDGIRLDFPAPPVHARNLYHTSAALWDAWSVYEPSSTGLFSSEKRTPVQAGSDQRVAMSAAAYRIVADRYVGAVGGAETMRRATRLLRDLCVDPDYHGTDGNTAVSVGNRVADLILAVAAGDHSMQSARYVDDSYTPVNAPMPVAERGTDLANPDRWQPLEMRERLTQNGLESSNTQVFIGPHWGFVEPFAVEMNQELGIPLDSPGAPPLFANPATRRAHIDGAVEVLRASSLLDPRSSRTIDIGPSSVGNNTLGANDGSGRDTNPVTEQPYAPNTLLEADYARVVAEFWADGPDSETPPGHWNSIAIEVTDQLAADGALQIGGDGPTIDRLEWDVKLFLAMNGAMHDAAIAAWGLKGYYDSVRPISTIRYLAELGQSTDESLPSYHRDGLPLVEGLIAVTTTESIGPGGEHEGSADAPGVIVVNAWTGRIGHAEPGLAGVDWIDARTWRPYQLDTFVTPSFAGYVSGHSAFSRAGAEVLTSITGSEYFPGGLGVHREAKFTLEFEFGPENDVVLQWATYFDAADEAGQSRIYGGIHPPYDDLAGRRVGSEVGRTAWLRTRELAGRE